MSRSSRKKEVSVKDDEIWGSGAYEGTAARTRPLSLEDILIRRKNKTVTAGDKDGSRDLGSLSEKANGNDPEHGRGYRHSKESKDRSSVKGGNKKRRDLETNSKRVDSETGRVKKHKDEKDSHHRSKMDDCQREEKETGKVKEHKSERKSPNRSRNNDYVTKEMVRAKDHKDEKLTKKEMGGAKEHKDEKQHDKEMVRAKEHKVERHRDKEISEANEHKDEKQHDKEMVRAKEHKVERHRDKEISEANEHKDEKQHDKEMARTKEKKDGKHRQYRRRNDNHLRDESDTRKEQSDVGKETFLDSERVKSERENRREHWSRDERRDRAEPEGSAVKKHDSDKYTEIAEMKDRNKGASKSNYEGSGRKRRRSRSREFRARDRSISLSPRGHKRTHDGWEHGESSLHSLKDKKQDTDVDRNRVSRNTGHTSNSSWDHGGHGNRLGGYSPRKRRSEAAIKTPSPTARSPEKKNAGWDLPPTGTSTMPADVPSSHQSVAVEHKITNIISVAPNNVGLLSGDLLGSVLSVSKGTDVTVDPVQLTQATRPLRRLYVENLPASASDKSVMECLNNFLMSSRANYTQGTQPCISCSINKEKGQALVEFLTAEDATSALSFDGRSFCSSILKIRRPKDFVDAATGISEKSLPAVDAISDIVDDSPHKIYIGGISKTLSSDMLMEIVSAFGRLKAYHFEVNDDIKQPCAFLEYEDKAITPKACAGLNGLKLGGQVLTVLQAFPSLSLEENTGNAPFYGIPEHAKPLLSEPTKVLKLKNVFNPEEFSLLLGSELEDMLEDIRIECARFGTVKSINYIKFEKMSQDIEGEEDSEKSTKEEVASIGVQEEAQEEGENAEEDRSSDGNLKENLVKTETAKIETLLEPHTSKDTVASDSGFIQNDNMMAEDELKHEETTELNQSVEEGKERVELKDELKQEETTELNRSVEEGKERVEIKEDEVFEQGCVFVEYVRSEAASISAHCLHGRLFDGRSVSVSYIPHDLYLSRFKK